MRLSVESRNPAYVTLTARPHRVGVLVPDIPGLPWQTVFRGALSSQSRVWGGSGNLVLPLRADTKESEVFWALTELLDADSWTVYAGSHRDLESLDPSAYLAWRALQDAELASWPSEIRAQALADAHAEPLTDQSIADDLHSLLVDRGATLNHDGRLVLHGLTSGIAQPPYPCVDVLDLAGLPEEVLDLEVNATPTLQLLAAAEFGCLSPDLRDAIDARGIKREVRKPTSDAELIRWIYELGLLLGRRAFSLAETGLAWYGTLPRAADTITVVAGEEPWDFALAYGLRRARAPAFWVPDSAFSTPVERHMAHRAISRLAQRAGAALVVTTATDEAACDALAAALEQPTRSVVIRTATWREALPRDVSRLLVTNRLGRREAMYLDGGVTPHLRTPVPDLSDDPTKLRWIANVEVESWAATRHRSLAPQLLDGSWVDARVTRHGLAYDGLRGFLPVGVPLDQLTAQPALRPLPLLDQLQRIADGSRWTCDLSQPGQFALATAGRFGGFAQLCAALRDPDIGEVLRAYLDGDRKQPGKCLSDRRRYLSLDECRALDLSMPAETVLNGLRAKGVVQAGLVLKCDRCKHADWYRPRDTDPEFSCTRCGANQVLDRRSWLQGAEPEWRYRLDEVVFQFIRHRGDIPALAAFERFAQSRETVQIVPEVILTDPFGQEREIDFAVTEGAALWLGEGFSGPRYGGTKRSEVKRLQRLADLAKLLNARGVILATSADELAPETQTRARTRFPGPWPALELRTRAFHLPRPATLLDDEVDSAEVWELKHQLDEARQLLRKSVALADADPRSPPPGGDRPSDDGDP